MLNRILYSFALVLVISGHLPLMSQEIAFVEALFDGQSQGANIIDGLDGAQTVVVSPDGRHVYVGGSMDDALVVFERDSVTGLLTWIEAVVDGVNGVDGLDGVEALAISHDGGTVYAAGLLENELAVFSRNAGTGTLSFVEVHADAPLNGIHSVVVSPDDQNVYAAGRNANALVVYTRNLADGTLTFLERPKDGIGGVDGLSGVTSVAVSPDGQNVYAVGQGEREISSFSRSAVDGSLTFLGVVPAGTMEGEIDSEGKAVVRLEPTGRHLYLLMHIDDPFEVLIHLYTRDPVSGALSIGRALRSTSAAQCSRGVEGDSGVAFAPNGTAVYVNHPFDKSVAAFTVDAASGELTLANTLCDDSIGQGDPGDVDGLWGSQDLAISPDGKFLYVVASDVEDAVTVLEITCQARGAEIVADETLLNETRLVQACDSITLGPNLFLDTGGDLTVRTGGTVEFIPPVQVLSGASLTVINDPPE